MTICIPDFLNIEKPYDSFYAGSCAYSDENMYVVLAEEDPEEAQVVEWNTSKMVNKSDVHQNYNKRNL